MDNVQQNNFIIKRVIDEMDKAVSIPSRDRAFLRDHDKTGCGFHRTSSKEARSWK
jgi:hypothetical protein